MIRRSTVLQAATLLVALPLQAQQFSLRLGGLRTHYADTLDASAASFAAQALWSGARSQGVVEASWSQFNTGNGAGQAWGSYAAMGPRTRNAGLGIRADGVANVVVGSAWTGTGIAELFGAVTSHGWTMTLGINGGGVRSVDTARFAVAGASLRTWLALGDWTIGAAATTTTSTVYRFTDASASADFHRGRVTAGVLAAGRRGDLGGRPWFQGRAAVRVTPQFSLEGALGSYARDVTGYDRGHYASFGVRLRIRAPAAPAARVAVTPSRVQVQRLDGDRTLVTFTVADAAPSIVGSWNEWTPTAMNDAGDGRWSVILPVGAGTFRFAVVLASGRWIVPDGVARLPDDFDGEVGILVVLR